MPLYPIHLLLVIAPIGAWVSASALDATGGNEVAARRLVGLGAVLALVGAGVLSAGGYLGGHLTYASGANVNPSERAGTAPSESLSVS